MAVPVLSAAPETKRCRAYFRRSSGSSNPSLGKPKRHRNFSIDMADRRGQNPAHLPKCDFRSAALAEVPPRFCIKDLGKGHQCFHTNAVGEFAFSHYLTSAGTAFESTN